MYFCLNGGTTGGGLSTEAFRALAADAGFDGADVNVGFGVEKGVSALRDLYASRKLKFGAWGLPGWRGDIAQHTQSLAQLPGLAQVAAALKIDSCVTWIMPS